MIFFFCSYSFVGRYQKDGGTSDVDDLTSFTHFFLSLSLVCLELSVHKKLVICPADKIDSNYLIEE